MSRGQKLTKEMRAKRHEGFRITVMILILYIAVGCTVISFIELASPDMLDRNSERSGTQTLMLIDLILLAIAAVVLVETVGYALITGMNILIGDNYVVDYRLLSSYRLSHLREEQSCYAHLQTTYLYLVMSPQELKALRREQRWSLWFDGRAVLPIDMAIPSKNFSTLYICRSTLKRLLREYARSKTTCFYVQLRFEFQEKCTVRTDFEQDYFLLSRWDIAELRRLYPPESDIRLDSAYGWQHFTWAQIDQYISTMFDAYQVVDLPPISPSSDE